MRKGVPGGCDSRHYSCNQRLSGRPGVEVKDGPFAALRGEVRKFRTASLDGIDAGLRITVAIELFGARLTPVDLDAAVVSPANCDCE